MGSTSTSTSTSTHRSRSNNNSNNEDRPRFFDSKAKSTCWANAETVPGRHPERWRKDAAGNIVCKRFVNCYGCLCFEYDHIVPFSKGGESTSDNCQILQTRVNRFKSDKEQMDTTQLKGYSCNVQFTVEVLGIRYQIGIPRKYFFDIDDINMLRGEKELDIVEMAVYGDVIRPGNQCRCKTVAEMLGRFKSKDHRAACKLPYDGESM